MLLAIVITREKNRNTIFSSKYHRWYNEAREKLFQNIAYTKVTELIVSGSIPKMDTTLPISIQQKLKKQKYGLSKYTSTLNRNDSIYYFRAVLYWVKILDTIPYFKEDGIDKITGEMKPLFFKGKDEKNAFMTILSSNLYYLYYTTWSSCQVINSRDFLIPFNFDDLSDNQKFSINNLARLLQDDYQKNSDIIKRSYSSRGRSFVMEKQYFFFIH